MSKTIEEYMALPYVKTITPGDKNECGGFFAEIPDLGRNTTCAWGKTEYEALQNLEQVMRSNISMWLDEGLDIPEPQTTKSYSGSFSLRVAPYIHRFVAESAIEQGISMNALLGLWIAQKMGLEEAKNEIKIKHTHTYYKIAEAEASEIKKKTTHNVNEINSYAADWLEAEAS